MTTANTDLYRTSSKMILVTRDPVYSHKAIVQGQYIGPKPYNYLTLAILVTIINPILGPVSILFSGKQILFHFLLFTCSFVMCVMNV